MTIFFSLCILADDVTTNLLWSELCNHVENFQRKFTATWKRQAKAEFSHAQYFIQNGLDLTKLYVACQAAWYSWFASSLGVSETDTMSSSA